MASHSVHDEFASVGGSDGTTPPGETITAGSANANAIFDNPHYQRHYATAPPIVWPTTSASARTTITGIDPSLLTRTPPPPPPRTQTQTLTSTSHAAGVLSGAPFVPSSSSQRFHPYSGQSSNARSIPVNVSSRTAAQPSSVSGAQHVQGASSGGQDHWQEVPLEGVQPGASFHGTGSNAASGSGLHGHGYGFRQGQMQSSSHEGVQPSFDIPSTGHGSQHGQSHSHPSAKPHPLQHLVDIHNAGPVSAFSRDPSTFTGITLYNVFHTYFL